MSYSYLKKIISEELNMKINIFENIFSNWVKNAEFGMYTACERRGGA